MEISRLYELYSQHQLVSTDTRQISEGCIFFALKGDNFDGNAYAAKALELGASYVVIDDQSYQAGERYILVDNVIKSLQQLATYHRDRLKIPVIGITGTNGKTTTKELINSVLSQKFKTYATRGNLNNHIGVPLTLLSIRPDIEIAIVEMGANHQKEIEMLCAIAKPSFGLITNIGKAHLEGFGGVEGVKKGKGELYEWLAASEGRAFVNRDNPILVDMARDRDLHNVIWYGTGNEGLISGHLTANDPFLGIEWQINHAETEGQIQEVQTHLTGTYNLENLLSAACIGTFFKLTPEEVSAGLRSYEPSNNRSQVTKTENNTLICDYYNANPSSMAVALDNFSSLKAGDKILILGDMFELGEDSAQEHSEILNKALTIPTKRRIFVGEAFYKAGEENGGADFFKTTDEAFTFLKSLAIQGATILIKGSRGMKLEKLVELF